MSETREALHACRRRERQLAREVATIERMLENDALARRAGCLEERGSITALQVMLRETETASSASESLRGLLQARLRRRLGLLRDELQAHRRQTSARIRSLEMELGSSSETVSRLHRQMRASLDS